MATTFSPVALDSTLRDVVDELHGISEKMGTGGSHIYAYHIDSNESDPSDAVVYLEDAAGMTPAYMDYTNDKFVWGSWENAFFMPRPCVLGFDGVVDYYLDPDDYSKKLDGTASDIADLTYEGNVMMEWGKNGKKIWYKIVPDSDDNTSATVYIADYQADEDFHAYSFVNSNNEYTNHFYTPVYNGSLDSSGRLRSISGITNAGYCVSKTAQQELDAAALCNPSGKLMWCTEVYADVTLINLLLILVSKSLDTETAFGNGRINQTSAQTSMLDTGTMNTKGLFWGDDGNDYGVKVFGIENWWGNQWRRIAGWMQINGVSKHKFTYGTFDGTTVTGYNTTASGYLTGENVSTTGSQYITKFAFDEDCMEPSAVGGSSSTYYCDYYWYAAGTMYALRGGACIFGAHCGAFAVRLYDGAGYAPWDVGAAPSCKPLS